MPLTLQSPQAHVHAAPRQSQATSALRSVPAGLPFPDSPYKGNRTAGGLSQLPSLTDHDVFQAHLFATGLFTLLSITTPVHGRTTFGLPIHQSIGGHWTV